jgi:hypothetical protein
MLFFSLLYSRQDTFFGPADVFHEATWNETLKYFTTPNIDVGQAARARTARVVTSASTNPQFTLPIIGSYFDYGETAAYQLVFGTWNLEADNIRDKISTPLEWVKYFFSKHMPEDTSSFSFSLFPLLLRLVGVAPALLLIVIS